MNSTPLPCETQVLLRRVCPALGILKSSNISTQMKALWLVASEGAKWVAHADMKKHWRTRGHLQELVRAGALVEIDSGRSRKYSFVLDFEAGPAIPAGEEEDEEAPGKPRFFTWTALVDYSWTPVTILIAAAVQRPIPKSMGKRSFNTLLNAVLGGTVCANSVRAVLKLLESLGLVSWSFTDIRWLGAQAGGGWGEAHSREEPKVSEPAREQRAAEPSRVIQAAVEPSTGLFAEADKLLEGVELSSDNRRMFREALLLAELKASERPESIVLRACDDTFMRRWGSSRTNHPEDLEQIRNVAVWIQSRAQSVDKKGTGLKRRIEEYGAWGTVLQLARVDITPDFRSKPSVRSWLDPKGKYIDVILDKLLEKPLPRIQFTRLEEIRAELDKLKDLGRQRAAEEEARRPAREAAAKAQAEKQARKDAAYSAVDWSLVRKKTAELQVAKTALDGDMKFWGQFPNSERGPISVAKFQAVVDGLEQELAELRRPFTEFEAAEKEAQR